MKLRLGRSRLLRKIPSTHAIFSGASEARSSKSSWDHPKPLRRICPIGYFHGSAPRRAPDPGLSSVRHSDTAMEHRSATDQRRGMGVRVGVAPEFLTLADCRGLLPGTISQASQ